MYIIRLIRGKRYYDMQHLYLKKFLLTSPNYIYYILDYIGNYKLFIYENYELFLTGINDKIVNGICKVVSLTLHRYKDSASQSYVKNLIVELIKKQPDATIKHMTTVISEQATWHKNVVAT